MEHFNASNSIVRSYTFPYVSSIPCSMDSLRRYIAQLSAAVVYRYNDARGILTCQTLEKFSKALTTWFLPINFDLDPYEVSKRIKHIDELCSEQLLASTVPHQIPTQVEEQVQSETRKLCAKLYPTRTSMTFETGGSAVPIEIQPSITNTFNAEKTYRNVKKLCSRKIERIMKRVIGRRQNNIVLVTDERETLEHSLAHFDDSVTVLSKPGLKLENIMDLLKRHPLYKKGTVFVVMAGTHDLLQPVDEHFWDTEQRIVYRRHINCDNWLIKQALDLHENILSNTTHDTILFSDLIPISLDIDKKTCHNENRFLFTEDVEKFRFEIEQYRRRLWKRTIVKQYDSNMAKKGAYVDEDSDSDDSIDVCT